MTLPETKLQAKMALENLISQCYDELRNMERFSDDRQLVATYDLEHSFKRALEAAEQFQDAYDAQ